MSRRHERRPCLRWVPPSMTTSYGDDQDAQPPTPDGQPPEAGDEGGGKQTASDPDPDPGQADDPPTDEPTDHSGTSGGSDS